MFRFRTPAIGLVRRTGAAMLLLLFSAHAGDGLMAALCPPGLSDHLSAPMGVMEGDSAVQTGEAEFSDSSHTSGPTQDVQELEDHPEADDQSGGMPCPFGLASGVVCGGAATLGSSSSFYAPIPPADLHRVIPDPGDTAGTLLSLKLFRPPRA